MATSKTKAKKKVAKRMKPKTTPPIYGKMGATVENWPKVDKHGRVLLQAKVSEDLYEDLRARATAESRSISNYTEIFLRRALKESAPISDVSPETAGLRLKKASK